MRSIEFCVPNVPNLMFCKQLVCDYSIVRWKHFKREHIQLMP